MFFYKLSWNNRVHSLNILFSSIFFKCTGLTIALLKGNIHCMKALLSYPDLDVDAKDDDGRTLVSMLSNQFSKASFDTI